MHQFFAALDAISWAAIIAFSILLAVIYPALLYFRRQEKKAAASQRTQR